MKALKQWGQDFAASWWTVVENLLKDKDQGPLLVFYDSSQNIFERKSAVPDCPSFKLTRNFRNTQEIAWVVGEKERLRPEQITVLSPHKRENSCLAGLSEVAEVPLADLPSEREGAVLHTTIGAFKGLESDVENHVYAKGDWMG